MKKTIAVEIKGVTPMLQHRFGEQSEVGIGKNTRRVNIQAEEPRTVAERAVYRDKEGCIYFPSAAILRLLREAGGAHKQKGSRKSLKYIVPAAVRILSEALPLYNGDGSRLRDFEVDSRPVTIPATKGRVMRHRPRFDCWSSRFELVIDTDVLSDDDVQAMLVEGGQQIGLGDYRPEKGGPFGCFTVVHWKEAKA